jgi:hypothetical protein
MATLYRKTEKGQAEVATRAHHLPQRLRAALILVDGRRTDDELTSILPGEATSTLNWLTESGFIEIASVVREHSDAPSSNGSVSTPSRQALSGASSQRAGTHSTHGSSSTLRHAAATSSGSSSHLSQGTVNARTRADGSRPLLSDGPPASRTPIDQLRREAARELTRLLGPQVDNLCIRMERAGSREELGPLLKIAFEGVRNLRGDNAAKTFHAQYIEGFMV